MKLGGSFDFDSARVGVDDFGALIEMIELFNGFAVPAHTVGFGIEFE